jgi:hypothetical protein
LHALKQYAHEIANDQEVIKTISLHRPPLFGLMNGRFNDMFTKIIDESKGKEGEALDKVKDVPKVEIDEKINKAAVEKQIDEHIPKVEAAGSHKHPLTAEEFSARMNKIVHDCTAFVDSYDYHKGHLEKTQAGGQDSPYLRGQVAEATDGLKKYLKDNCANKETLVYLRKHEGKLFGDINKIYDNILNNTIKKLDSREMLASLTKDSPGLYEKVLNAEQRYIDLMVKAADAHQKRQGASNKDYAEFRKCFYDEKVVKLTLKQHVHEIAKDQEVAKTIALHRPPLFARMNERFNDVFAMATNKSKNKEGALVLNKDKDISKEEEKANKWPKENRIDALLFKFRTEALNNRPMGKEVLIGRMNKIIQDCTALIDSYNFHKGHLDQIHAENLESPYLNEKIGEITAELKTYLKTNCASKTKLVYLKEHEAKLFGYINKIYDNILNNTIKKLDSRDLLASLTKGNATFYFKVSKIEKDYMTLNKRYLDVEEKARSATSRNFIEIMDEKRAAKDDLDSFIKEIADDTEVIKMIKSHEPWILASMDRHSDNILSNNLNEQERHDVFIKTHQEFDKSLDKDERAWMIIDQCRELRQEFKDALPKGHRQPCEYLDPPTSLEKVTKEEYEEYAHELCRDGEMIQAIRQEDPFLFKEMNKQFDNMFAKALKEYERNEQYIQEHPELKSGISNEDRATVVIEKYNDLKQACQGNHAMQESFREFNYDEYSRDTGRAETTEEDLNIYACMAYQDKELMGQIKEQDEQVYNEMQEKFNEMEQENFERMQENQREFDL